MPAIGWSQNSILTRLAMLLPGTLHPSFFEVRRLGVAHPATRTHLSTPQSGVKPVSTWECT